MTHLDPVRLLAAATATLFLALPGAAAASPTDLDTSFGSGGFTQTQFNQVSPSGGSDAYRLALAPDGKIVAVGERRPSATPNQRDWAVARYTADGLLDTSFNSSGTAAALTGSFRHTGPEPYSAGALAVAVQSDTNILISGAGANDGQLVVVRLLGSGASPLFDATFGSSGMATIPVPTSTRTTARRIYVQPDGKIIVSGSYFAGNNGAGGDNVEHPFVARLLANGSPDTTFNAGSGVLALTSATCDGVAASDCPSDGLAVTADGSGVTTAIFIGGSDGGATIGGRVFKLIGTSGANFALDPTWGTGGAVQIDKTAVNNVTGLVVQPDGNVVAAGYAQSGPSFQCGIVRLTPSGGLDTSFGTNGVGRINILGSGGAGTCAENDLVRQADGKYLFSGLASDGNFSAGNQGIALGRFTANGQPDTSFVAGGGVQLAPVSPGAASGGVVLQGTKVTVAAGAGSPQSFLLARFSGGDLPTSGGSGGGGGGGDSTQQFFQDVGPSTPYSAAINAGAQRGWFSGYACGSVPAGPCVAPYNLPYFLPFNNVTRGQEAKGLAAAGGFAPAPRLPRAFSDVSPDSPFYLSVERLASQAILTGFACRGTSAASYERCIPPANLPYFRPAANVTRGQLADAVSAASGYTDTPRTPVFSDVKTTTANYVAIEQIAARGIVRGYADGTWRPQQAVTRGQFANALYLGTAIGKGPAVTPQLLTFPASSTVHVTRDGRFTLPGIRVQCPQAVIAVAQAVHGCPVTGLAVVTLGKNGKPRLVVSAARRAGAKQITIARTSFTIPAGKTSSVVFKLTNKAFAYLSGRRATITRRQLRALQAAVSVTVRGQLSRALAFSSQARITH